jgi:uncharacterized protein (UPF0335 family)
MSDGNVSADRLRLHIEAIERLLEEDKGIKEDLAERYKLARGEGFDVKTMKACVKLRRTNKDARDEADALLETYRNALGLN